MEFCKIPCDKRSYRGLELSNGLKILLVSDPNTYRTSVAFNVLCGSSRDPQDFPGLAHFYEHMFALGTRKYPKVNEIKRYVNFRGGHCYASTAFEHTRYNFEVHSEYLEKSLDQMVQFFVAPLFAEDAIHREVNALESEFLNSKMDDHRLIYTIQRSTFNVCPASCGNLKTLMEKPETAGKDLRTALMQFHESNYSADRITCCIVDRGSLNMLEAIVKRMDFDKIPNRTLSQTAEENRSVDLGHRVDIVPVKNTRKLIISFAIDTYENFWKCRPDLYFAEILNHTGKDSLFEFLVARGWIIELCSHPLSFTLTFTVFQISIELTQSGLNHVNDILKTVFHQIGALKAAGPQEFVYKELTRVSRFLYTHSEAERDEDFAQDLAKNLHFYPFEDIHTHRIVNNFEPDLIRHFIEELKPDKMNYFVISREAKLLNGLEKEEHYGVLCKQAKIDQKLLETLNSCLAKPDHKFSLPSRNPLIPDEVHLNMKTLIILENFFNEYSLGRSEISSAIFKPLENSTNSERIKISNSNLAEFYLQCYKISNLSHPHCKVHDNGIELSRSGYNENVFDLLQKDLETLFILEVDEQLFSTAHDIVLRRSQDSQMEDSATQSLNLLCQLLHINLEKGSSDLSSSELNSFIASIWKAFYVEITVKGNIRFQEAKIRSQNLLDIINKKTSCNQGLKKDESNHGTSKILKIKEPIFYDICRDALEENCVTVFFQSGQSELLKPFAVILNIFIFNQLRTIEQLGYCALASTLGTGKASGVVVVVRSRRNPDFIKQRNEKTIATFRDYLMELSGKEIAALSKTSQTCFKRKDLLSFFDNYISSKRQLTIRCWSGSTVQERGVKPTNFEEFKRNFMESG
ncbi:hypothetical protein L596_013158 [Steinernema carpocapsae]|uniref:Peptidase M16 N-terminal domain-containing protein n=1 Tax=Steinernema carpocapsae TaxID=34508 RepID=A0A4U5P056_STECR|nr:hypothetical protein L596_013158 [Steinernema carpocapsae]